MTIDEKIEHLKDYLKHRLDIIYNDIPRWTSNAKYQLPTFEYYLQNCIIDKGGKYDFTKKYKSPIFTTNIEIKDSFFKDKVVVESYGYYSSWMGTPFNHESFSKQIKN